MNADSHYRSRFVWMLSLSIGVAIAFAAAGENYLAKIMVGGESVPFSMLIRWSTIFWVGWSLLAPFVVEVSSRNLLQPDQWLRSLGILLAGAAFFWLMHTLIEVTAMRLIPDYRRLHGGSISGAFLSHLERSWHLNLLVYAAIAGAAQWITIYRRYRQQETSAARLQAAVAKAEIHALKMQLHPHFLFNALHSVSTLMHRDVESADRMLVRLSDVLRSAIDSSASDTTSLGEEIDFLNKYLAVEEIRFRDRLNVDIDVPKRLERARIPDLLLQPLVENAIRHGFEPQSGSFHLRIAATETPPGRLQLTVEDDGAGLPASGRIAEGLGLSLTRERLELLYGEAAELSIRARANGGVAARISLPLQMPIDAS